jgi:hypothetical protein
VQSPLDVYSRLPPPQEKLRFRRTDQGGATIAIILELPLGRDQVSVGLGELRQHRYLDGNGVVLLLPIGGHTGVEGGRFVHSQPPGSLRAAGYAGNRSGLAELNGRNVTYGYDNDYRLKSETIASDPAANNGAESRTYDYVGNRLTLNSTIPLLPGAMSYSYDSNDRLTTDTYDNDGNTTVSGGITNTYDFENHLLKQLHHCDHGVRWRRQPRQRNWCGRDHQVSGRHSESAGYSQIMDEPVSGAVTRTYAYGLQRISQNKLVSG